MFAVLSAFYNDYSREVFTARSETPWATVVLWCKIQIVLGMVLHGVSLFRPYWSRPKLVCRMALDVLFAGIAVWTLTIDGIWLIVYLMLIGLIIFSLGEVGYNIYRFLDTEPGAPGTATPDLSATLLGVTAAAKGIGEQIEAASEAGNGGARAPRREENAAPEEPER